MLLVAGGCASSVDDDDSTTRASNDDDSAPSTDLDGDGYTLEEGDCDDSNASVHPGVKTDGCDGIDEDCDGMDLTTIVYERENISIHIFPNPAAEYLQLELSAPIELEIRMLDPNGRQLQASRHISRSIQLNLVDLPSGLYFLEIRSREGERWVIEKVVKE